jgi:tryptophan synthase alpha chain
VKTKLIGYFSIGYPTVEESMKIADSYLRNGIDTIEIGYPTDNPYLDNEYIGNTLRCAQQNLSSNDMVFDAVDRLLSLRDNLPVILLAYDKSIRAAGVENFMTRAQKSGISDVILVGEEDESTKETLIANGFQISCYVTFSMPDKEVHLAQNSNGFIYLQAKSDGKVREGCETLGKCVEYLRSQGIRNPIYAGVGISTPDDVKMVAQAKAEGVFIGSALLKQIGNPEQLTSYVQSLRLARDAAV